MQEKWCNYDKHWVALSEFSWLPKFNKPHSECKSCAVKRQRAYYSRNREKFLANRRAYQRRNRDKILAQDKEGRRRRTQQVLTHYSNGTMACACCGEHHIEMLQLDHIDADGANHRKALKKVEGGGTGSGWFIYKWLLENGLPDGYQVLCASCNMGKFRSGVNICPHELARQKLMAEGVARLNQAA